MKRATQTLPWAALLALGDAQTNTIINDPNDTGVVTVYYSTCPTAATTTVTLPSTITYCAGGAPCNSGGPIITAPPNPDDAHTSTVLQLTFTGTDGKVTELNEYVTVYDAPCTRGPGMCQATYTITEECPCHSTRNPDVLPTGFTTSVHVCSVCGPDNGPMTMTQTLPCSTGPYANVTPTLGPSPTAGAYASAGANAAASAGAGASSNGSGAGAGAGSGAGAGAGAGSGSNGSGAGASAGAGAGASAEAGAGSNGAGSNAPGAGAGAGAAASAGSGSNGAGAGSNGAAAGAGMGGVGNLSPSSGAGMANNNGTIQPYPGAADRTAFAFSTLFVALVGSLAWML